MTIPQPLLIVSDIDGTFVTSAERVTARLREVVARVVDKQCAFALATGRPHRWLFPVLDQLPVAPVCATANGAVLYDPQADEVLSAAELDPAIMRTVVAQARAALGPHVPLGVAVERCGGSVAGAGAADEDLFVVSPDYVHTWDAQGFQVRAEAELLASPAVKLLLRREDLSSAQMYAAVAPAIDPAQAHVTYSMPDGLLEVAAPGITKQRAVAQLAQRYQVPRERVICFGDMPNDIEMLRWAGLGVAMGNASAEVKQAADIVTTSNDDDGVARVLERWF
ncbi:HAD family hydrolase [Corynebacterium uberis]|uniref:HAD family hydrolase n=1 Tax=Corynebacterium TaxID=1716 RepID=UPI001D0AF63C|nr:HAD family hydrolase [Corynebacterium uberis]MCZ9309588.1 HAD family hydrolase [Corynebacterium sp. c6VSa_13]UDL73398.1 HAD family hydrolase [Corynebacterium uberis]UDL75723.1 HAD family hydrolase [Corynebacterium uberis]UDL77935.1 HAD family hydrolase [Corynebacterium uberis]UDL80219.1 HAD family hydrolase [Corynebacterium uberis]